MRHSIELYTFSPSTGLFTRLSTLENFDNLQYNDELNEIGQCSFRVNIWNEGVSQTNLLPWFVKVLIKRESTPVWAGVIVDVNRTTTAEAGSISVRCQSYFAMLKKKYIYTKTFVENNVADIPMDYIDTVQARTNGDIGINQGTIETITDSQDTVENISVYDAIRNLYDNENSFDFEFKPVLDANGLLSHINYNAYQLKGSLLSSSPKLELGVNVRSVKSSTDADVYNYIRVQGQGTGNNTPYAESENADLYTSYNRLEGISSQSNINSVSRLQNFADTKILNNAIVQFNYELDVLDGTMPGYNISVGDRINTDLAVGTGLEISGIKRIKTKTVKVDSEGHEEISYQLLNSR